MSPQWTPGPSFTACISRASFPVTGGLSPSHGLHLPLPTLIPFPGSTASHENTSPSVPLSQDPPSFLSQASPLLTPLPFSRLNSSFSLLWGLPEYPQPSTPSRILPGPSDLLCTTGGPPQHTHTCSVSVPRVPHRVLQGYHRPPWSPSPQPLPRAPRGPPEPLPLQPRQTTQPVAAVYKDTRFLTVTRAASSPSPRSRRGVRARLARRPISARFRS